MLPQVIGIEFAAEGFPAEVEQLLLSSVWQ